MDPDTQPLLQTVLKIYRCPSDVTPGLNPYRKMGPEEDVEIGTSNYVACRRGGPGGAGLGIFNDINSLFYNGGNSSCSMRDVTDGLSNTIAVGERGHMQIVPSPANFNSDIYAAAVWPGFGPTYSLKECNSTGNCVSSDGLAFTCEYQINSGRLAGGSFGNASKTIQSYHEGGAVIMKVEPIS